MTTSRAPESRLNLNQSGGTTVLVLYPLPYVARLYARLNPPFLPTTAAKTEHKGPRMGRRRGAISARSDDARSRP